MNICDIKIPQVNYQSTTTGSPVLWVRWEGEVGAGATIQVDASTGDLTFTTDGSNADTTVSTDGVIDVSTAAENTMGEVVDVINASPNWCAVLLAGIRSQSSDNVLTTLAATDVSTQTYKRNGIYLYGDGAVSPYYMSYVITGFDPKNYVKGRNPDTGCISFLNYVYALGTFSSAGSLLIYSASQSGETLILPYTLTSGTASTLGSTSTCCPFIASFPEERLVVILDDDNTTSGDVLHTIGYTIDLTGKRIPCHRPTN